MTRLTDADQTRVADLVRAVSRSEILPRFQNLDSTQIDQKNGPQDLVTEADLAAEQHLTEGLRRLFPGALITGEEAVSRDPALRDAMDQADLCFVIDPVDGTWNFAHGLPLFGVILAGLSRGKPFFGMLHDPVMDNWMIAQTGARARQVWADGRSRELRVAASAPLAELAGYMHFFLLPQHLQERLARALPGFGRVYAIRCSCHEYRTVAQGSADFCLSGMLNPWDHAAGAVIVEAAGGHVAMLDGQPYGTAIRDGHLLVAPDITSWNAIRDHLAPFLETGA